MAFFFSSKLAIPCAVKNLAAFLTPLSCTRASALVKNVSYIFGPKEMNFSRRLASTRPRRGFLDLFPEFPGSLTAAREAVGLPCLVRSPQA